MSSCKGLLKTYLREYEHPDLAMRDIVPVLQHFKDLRPALEPFVFSDGRVQHLLQLEGTIPIFYRGNTYNIPVQLWLLDEHPFHPPMVYVKPTNTMQIKAGRYERESGPTVPEAVEMGPSYTVAACKEPAAKPEPERQPVKIVDLSRPMEQWSVDEVAVWLGTLGLAQYQDNFRKHAVDGTELLALTSSDLEGPLGVEPLGHRKKILRNRQQADDSTNPCEIEISGVSMIKKDSF